jgi:hypothetical protein
MRLGATDMNVPQPIPLTDTFPGLSNAWKTRPPVLQPLEYDTVKKSKPPGVTIITPGDQSSNTDILSLHFNFEEAAETGENADTVQADEVEASAPGATEASSGTTV